MQLGQATDFQVDGVRLGIVVFRVEPDGEHPRGSSAGDVGRRAVADHGRLVGETAEPLDGDLKQRPLGFADGRRSHARRDRDRLGKRTAAGIEGTRPDREPRIEIDREERGPRRDRARGRTKAIVAEIMVDPDDDRFGLVPAIDRQAACDPRIP